MGTFRGERKLGTGYDVGARTVTKKGRVRFCGYTFEHPSLLPYARKRVWLHGWAGEYDVWDVEIWTIADRSQAWKVKIGLIDYVPTMEVERGSLRWICRLDANKHAIAKRWEHNRK